MAPAAGRSGVAPSGPARVAFVHQGGQPMTVRGPITGIEYTFGRPGAVVEVDARDQVLLASLRQLRRVGQR